VKIICSTSNGFVRPPAYPVQDIITTCRQPISESNANRRIAKALKTDAVADNLLNRESEAHGPRAILLTDITYIINGKAPRCYMSTIIDACTKELLAWVLSESLEIDFVLKTVEDAIAKHGIEMNTETMIHSDQGAHYTSVQFRSLKCTL